MKKKPIWITTTIIALAFVSLWLLPRILHHDNAGIFPSTAYQVKGAANSYLSDPKKLFSNLHITVDAQIDERFQVTTYTIFGIPNDHYILKCSPHDATAKITEDHVRVDCSGIESGEFTS